MYPALRRILRMIAMLAASLPLASVTAYGEDAGTLMRIPIEPPVAWSG